MTYFLYEKEKTDAEQIISWDVHVFKPCLSNGFRTENEIINKKTRLARIMFYLITKGKFCIYYVKDSATEQVVHTSYLLAKCLKFPFCCANDVEIGPCYTEKAWRGKGIYTQVLKYITQTAKAERFYIFANETNEASIRGIEKAGFVRCGRIMKTRWLKRYIRICE